VTASIGVEQEYFEAVLSIPKAAENPILAAISPSYYADAEKLLEHRTAILESGSIMLYRRDSADD
jgi:hypothetical protein